MSNQYERQWEIVHEVEFDLLDGNLVRLEWLRRENPQQPESFWEDLRMYTTAGFGPKRMRQFRVLPSGRMFESEWVPVIFTTIVQATEDLRTAPFTTFTDFTRRLRWISNELWEDPYDLPEAEVSTFKTACHEQAVEDAVAMFLDPELIEPDDGTSLEGLE